MLNRIILLTSLIALTGILAFSELDQPAYAATDYIISDDTTGGDCGTLGGTLYNETNTCTFTNSVSIGYDDSLTVDENVTVILQGGAGDFSGALDNGGTLTNNGIMKIIGGDGDESGVLFNGFSTFTNSVMQPLLEQL